jgi:probable F420-dependent oxidoreductase
MKIRIGYGLGTTSASNDQDRFTALVDNLELLEFDSLWFSDRLSGSSPEPMVAMAYAAGRTKKLKFGTAVIVVPGRNPVVLAKSIASLDQLSGGRVLPAFGLGIADAGEHQAFGVNPKDRGRWFNEAVPLMKRLWSEDRVSHEGKRFKIENVTVRPKPIQDPIEVWLGGRAPLELKRVAVHGDGWLPSFTTPAEVEQGRAVIEQLTTEHDREIEDEHYGVLIPYRAENEVLNDRFRKILATRGHEDSAEEVLPTLESLPKAIQRFIDVGFSKFVLVPTTEPLNWATHLGEVASLVKPMEN